MKLCLPEVSIGRPVLVRVQVNEKSGARSVLEPWSRPLILLPESLTVRDPGWNDGYLTLDKATWASDVLSAERSRACLCESVFTM